MSPLKGTISIGNTSSNHQFSGDMLVFGGVQTNKPPGTSVSGSINDTCKRATCLVCILFMACGEMLMEEILCELMG